MPYCLILGSITFSMGHASLPSITLTIGDAILPCTTLADNIRTAWTLKWLSNGDYVPGQNGISFLTKANSDGIDGGLLLRIPPYTLFAIPFVFQLFFSSYRIPRPWNYTTPRIYHRFPRDDLAISGGAGAWFTVCMIWLTLTGGRHGNLHDLSIVGVSWVWALRYRCYTTPQYGRLWSIRSVDDPSNL